MSSSKVIESFKKICNAEATQAIAYFYFEFNDTGKQGVQNFVSSLIVQLCNQLPDLPHELEDLHSKCRNGQQIITLQKLTTILKNLIPSFTNVYIIVDAIHECPKSGDQRDELLAVALDISRSGSQLLVTSRLEIDIAEAFKSEANISIDKMLVEADITLHVANELATDVRLRKWSSDIKADIEKTLVEGSNGMQAFIAHRNLTED